MSFDYRAYYRNIYSAEPDYGSFDHSRSARKHILDQKPKSLIDIGCGNGEFLQYMHRFSPETTLYGIDVAGQGYDGTVVFNQSATEKWPVDSVDIVTAFDFLEHLHEDDVDFVISEMGRVSSEVYAKIAYGPSYAKAPDGSDPHLTVKPPTWWIAKFKEHGFEPFGYIHPEGEYVQSDIVLVFKRTQDEPGHANKRGE